MKLTTHLDLMLRSRTVEPIPQLPYMSLWRGAKLVKHRDNITFNMRSYSFLSIFLAQSL
jgi:hypothetical protein